MGLGFITACGSIKPNDPIEPSSSPSPSPTPTIIFPLKVSGNRFVDLTDKEIFLAGVIGCCEDLNWPLARRGYISSSTPSMIQKIASFGANYTHIRLGPYIDVPHDSSGRFRPYETIDGKANLNAWNINYWTEVKAVASLALTYNMVLEVDLIDFWGLKDSSQNEIRHPWRRENNIQKFAGGDCSIGKFPPHIYAKEFVKKAVQELGQFPNIIWQISNESGICGTSVAFESGIIEIIKTWDPMRHLIGTNSETAEIESLPEIDYISLHQQLAAHPESKPVQINEYPFSSPESFKRELEIAYSRGTYFHYWRGDDSEEEFNRTLEVLKEFRRTH